MIRTTNVRDGWVDTINVKYVEEEVYKKWIRRGAPIKGDVILTREAPLGEVGLLRNDEGVFLGQRLVMYRANPKKLDNRFLLYSFLHSDLQGQIKSFGSGSTVEHMRVPDCEKLIIKLPPLPTQRKIASILSTYDDLIENNTRRIKILEEMAQAIYREWFVNFRFPGHEQIRMVDSPLGKVPEGWKVVPLEFLITEHIGGGWGKEESEDYFTEPAWVIRGTDIPGVRHCQYDSVPLRYHTVSNLKSRRLKPCDIVFEVSGGSKGQPVGRSLFITNQLLSAFGEDDVICASFCKRVEPKREIYRAEILYSSFVEGYTSGEIDQYQVQSTGITNFKWTEYLQQAQRAVPLRELQDSFCDIAGPIFTQIATVGLKTANLRKTRDLLLPRLISGQLEIKI